METMVRLSAKHRDKLKIISKSTGKHMKFILGELVDAEYKRHLKRVTSSQAESE